MNDRRCYSVAIHTDTLCHPLSNCRTSPDIYISWLRSPQMLMLTSEQLGKIMCPDIAYPCILICCHIKKTLHLPWDLIKALSAVLIGKNGALALYTGLYRYLRKAEKKETASGIKAHCLNCACSRSLCHCSSKHQPCHDMIYAKCSRSSGPGNLAASLNTQK